jgi:hypothetical protein
MMIPAPPTNPDPYSGRLFVALLGLATAFVGCYMANESGISEGSVGLVLLGSVMTIGAASLRMSRLIFGDRLSGSSSRTGPGRWSPPESGGDRPTPDSE